jgi:hypothetical protein
MGTNYYWYKAPKCECCDREYEPLHIGKSSAGWCFSLHVMPDRNINNLKDWEALFDLAGSYIRDEYHQTIPADKMLNIIMARGSAQPLTWTHLQFIENHAVRGPNNLVRFNINGRHCIGHGAGTWDYIVGEFS